MKKRNIIIASAFLLLAAAAVFFWARAQEMKKASDPHVTAETYLNGLLPEAGEERVDRLTGYELSAGYKSGYRKAHIQGSAEYIDTEKLAEGFTEAVNARLAQLVDEARLASDVYNEDKSFKAEVLQKAFDEVLFQRLKDENYRTQGEMAVELRYDGQTWTVDSASLPTDALNGDETEQKLYEEAAAGAQYVKKQYRIAQDAASGPAPDQSCFGSTDDPAVIEELLASDAAQALLNGQTPAWNRDLDFIPGRLMRYYLDETILVLQWQEVTALAVGTFSEVFVADGSQIRRKLVDDSAGSFNYEYPTELAKQANAVLAVGGDLYYHSRACGIVVYNREIYRFEPNTCDTCFITAGGDMLYAKAGQLTDRTEAERFIEENDVLFSLCFGPVMIEDGQDVTPYKYPYGEINDTYARSSLGMLGRHHYLTMNINCEWGGYYYLATLRQATEAMLAHGCITAYALVEGQAACTVLHGELINVVQFNTEKLTSDIIYFATALPE